MASTSTQAFSVMPIIGYALLAVLVSYLAIRFASHIRSRFLLSPTPLPKPVSGKSSTLLGSSTGWDWRKWTSNLVLPRVPYWSKVPAAAEAVVGKAKAVATAKNLSVELLPTAAPPPPPSSIPTPGPSSVSMLRSQLVDLSTPTPSRPTAPYLPVTPSLTTGSTSNSFPASPRTPSPSPFASYTGTSSISKAIFYPAPPHPSYPRPPSPHALLATTPPQKYPHRRSRSLGGVPVRRLSGNAGSSLRNAVDVDLDDEVELKDMSHRFPNHLRGTSREHLLIDFSSSNSSDEEDIRISPAASDIGILSSEKRSLIQVDAAMVGRHMPLVDLSEVDDNIISKKEEHDKESWKWFGPGFPSLSYAPMRHVMDSKEKEGFRRTGNLVDIVSNYEQQPEQGLGLQNRSIQVHRAEFYVSPREAVLVDVEDERKYEQVHTKKENEPLLNLYDDDQIKLVDVDVEEAIATREKPTLQIPSNSPSYASVITTPVLVKSSFSHPHPLEGVAHVTTLPEIPQSKPVLILESTTSSVPNLKEVEDKLTDVQQSLLFAESESENEHTGEALSATPPTVASPSVDSDIDNESVFEYPGSSEVPSTHLTELSSPLIISLSGPIDHPQGPTTIEDAGIPSKHGNWSWHEVDVEDPWGSHVEDIVDPDVSTPESEVFVYTGRDAVLAPPTGSRVENTEQDEQEPGYVHVVVDALSTKQGSEVIEKIPSGSLPGTVLPAYMDDVEEVPTLMLDTKEEDHISTHEQVMEEDSTPKATPASVKLQLSEESVVVPIVLVEDTVRATIPSEFEYPDPGLLPLPESPTSAPDLLSISTSIVSVMKKDKDEQDLKLLSPSQTPTPPASPPISPLRFISPSTITGLPSPQLKVMSPLPNSDDMEDKENVTPVAVTPIETSKPLLSVKIDQIESTSPRLRRRVLTSVSSNDNEMEVSKEGLAVDKEPTVQSPELKLSSSLPGSFPEPSIVSAVSSATPAATIASRLAQASDTLVPRPSARAIIRSPLQIALAMQLRPGLGAGADPAWMVRFLMAMFGWLAVAVSGGEY